MPVIPSQRVAPPPTALAAPWPTPPTHHGDPGSIDHRRHDRRRLWWAVVAVAVVLVLGASVWWLVVVPGSRTDVTPSSNAVAAPVVVPPVASSPSGPQVRSGPAVCPSAVSLVAVFTRADAHYGPGAHPIGAAVCAGGFATVRLTSPTTPDGLSTIYALGPPIRFLAAGTGPICADAPGQGPDVVVPRSAAAKLNCMTTTAPSRSGGSAAPPVTPTLGVLFSPDVKGYGSVRPHEINNDGDGTSLITGVSWSSWGGPQAVGTGDATYVAPGQASYQGTEQRATVVAFDLGVCGGHPAYRHVTWFFPQHGESVHSGDHTAFEACTGP